MINACYPIYRERTGMPGYRQKSADGKKQTGTDYGDNSKGRKVTGFFKKPDGRIKKFGEKDGTNAEQG